MKLFLPLIALVAGGCGLPERNEASALLERGNTELVKPLIDSARKYYAPETFEVNFTSAVVDIVRVRHVGGKGSSLEALFFAPKGQYCWHGLKRSGMVFSDPPKAPEGATRIVIFEESNGPLYQVSVPPWCHIGLVDADGDTGNVELLIWSDLGTGSRSAFFSIYRLNRDSCELQLGLSLNPNGSKTVGYVESQVVQTPEGPKTVYNRRTRPLSKKRGKWELGHRNGNGLVTVSESVDGGQKEVAQFTYDKASRVWIGPVGGEDELWMVNPIPWIEAEFILFKDLEGGSLLDPGGFKALSKDVDHFRAAEESAVEEGLKK